MKILCVCSQGNKRSVFTKFILNHSHDALALGVDVNSPETIRLLADWSEVILLAEPEMKRHIPVKFQKKVDQRFSIGKDIYPASIGGILKEVCYRKLKELKYI